MVVDVNTDDGAGDINISTPRELIQGTYISAGDTPGNAREYHVGPDGRFLMQRRGDQQDSDGQILTQVVLVQNWFEELKARVPIP